MAYRTRCSDVSLPSPSPRCSVGLAVGSAIWSPCDRLGFRRSTIVSVDAASDSFLIGDCSGQERVRQSEVRPCYDAGDEHTCEDNTTLVHLDEANILDNLNRRFVRDEIYTYTANVLLAVNPYKQVKGLYTPDRMREYRNRTMGTRPPHPYAIADTAFRQLLRDRQSQALVISGESGAGKTETAKIVTRYFAGTSRTDEKSSSQIQEKILNANPILESFGNASTVRNRNSSRFGKYTEMFFNQVGTLTGFGIRTFLLESSRVVGQQDFEQNYHIFYEMLAGLSPANLEAMQLSSRTKYRLLYTGKAVAVKESTEELEHRARRFLELRQSLATVGIDPALEREIYKTLAGLLHLGQVSFGEPEDPAPGEAPRRPPGDDQRPPAVEGGDSLEYAAGLLGFSLNKLREVLRWRTVRVGGQEIDKAREKSQAQQTLQSVMKVLYQRLFTQIVALINASSGAAGRTSDSYRNLRIGTLDIYGFERLETNSFEQLCINLANERLQQFFIEEVLRAEQRMYKEECLMIDAVQLPDSQPVVNGIAEVVAILDEHSLRSNKNLASSEPDKKFGEHLNRVVIADRARSHGVVLPLKLKATRDSSLAQGRNDGFVIRHYAGDVTYYTKNFVEKNNDSLVPEVEHLLLTSSMALVRSLADEQGVVLCGERVHSVAKRFVVDLDQLLLTLQECGVHYIRCFNPNTRRQPGLFDKKYVLDQVVQCGTVELVNIMHNGYPHRCLLKELRNRFKDLLPTDMVANYSNQHFVLAIMLAFQIDKSQWTLGTERLFLKAGQLRVLETLRDEGSTPCQDMLRRIRALFARRRMKAAVTMISFARWLPKHVRESRLQRFHSKLSKVVFIFVRLNRWLQKARKTIYGDISDIVGRPRIFLTPIATSIPSREVALVDARRSDEGVLVYDGCAVFYTRLQAEAAKPHSPGQFSGFFHLDIYGTCTAVPLASGCGSARQRSNRGVPIADMCQHAHDLQVFATVTTAGHGMVWRWMGVRDESSASNHHQASVIQEVKILAKFVLPDCYRVLQICILNALPEGYTLPQGKGYLLAVVVQYCSSYRLLLIHTTLAGHVTEAIKHVDDHCGLPSPSLRFLTGSDSGRLVGVGGQGFLRFYGVEASSSRLSLSLVQDLGEYAEVKEGCAETCLPSPSSSQPNEDWIVVGDTVGRLYGWYFGTRENGGAEYKPGQSGRFRTNLHTDGLPIGSLIQTYTEVTGHERKSACRSFEQRMAADSKSFLSLDRGGKLVTWRRKQLDGWQSEKDMTVCLGSGRYAAGCASRAQPHLVLILDLADRRLICFNSSTKTLDCVCSVA